MERRDTARVPTTRTFTKRDASGAEVEAREIAGYAAVYYDGTPATEYELLDEDGQRLGFERIMPGAFEPNLGDDVRGLFDHSTTHVLGRNGRTMELKSDDVGLEYRIEVGDTTTAANCVNCLQRGDIDGSSFSFLDPVAKWKFGVERDGELVNVRNIKGFGQIKDVGPVTFPAYSGATAGARSDNPFSDARSEFRAAIAERDEARAAIAARDQADVYLATMPKR